MRKEATRAEQILWFRLKGRQLGAKFRRQYGVGKYIVDFCSPELRLVVEIDGDVHFLNKEKVGLDLVRQEYLERFGFRVIRFSNLDILYNIDNTLEKLKSSFK